MGGILQAAITHMRPHMPCITNHDGASYRSHCSLCKITQRRVAAPWSDGNTDSCPSCPPLLSLRFAALAEVSQPDEEPGRLSRILATVEQAKAEVAAQRARQDEEQSSKEQASGAAARRGPAAGSRQPALPHQPYDSSGDKSRTSDSTLRAFSARGMWTAACHTPWGPCGGHSHGSQSLLQSSTRPFPTQAPPQAERHILSTAAGAVVSAAEDLKAILDRARAEIEAAQQRESEEDAADREPQPWVRSGGSCSFVGEGKQWGRGSAALNCAVGAGFLLGL